MTAGSARGRRWSPLVYGVKPNVAVEEPCEVLRRFLSLKSGKRGTLLGMSILEWAGLLLFAFLAVIFFAAFAPPSEPQVNVVIQGASARFALQGNLLSLLRTPVAGAVRTSETLSDLLVSDPEAAAGSVLDVFSSVYPGSAWFVRVYPLRGTDRLAFADAHDGKPFVEVASRSQVSLKEGSFVGCADLDVDALLGDVVKLESLAPLALAEAFVPSADGVVRIVACEVHPR